MNSVHYRTESLERFLEDLAGGTSTPGGGAVAALAAAMAAGLVAMVARFSTKTLPTAGDLAEAADELRRRATNLADEDARAYEAVKAAYGLPKDSSDRGERIRTALEAATHVPLRLADLGAQIAVMASQLRNDGNRNLEGDAITAGLLAAAAVRAASVLVEGNVTLGRLDASLSARARDHVLAVSRLEPAR